MAKAARKAAREASEVTTPAVKDELGDLLVSKGLTTPYVLDLNQKLTVPYDMELRAPWNLPSRLFRFPIAVTAFRNGVQRRIGLMHPDLIEHPFVKVVAEAIGEEIPVALVGDNGQSYPNMGNWWHACDLVDAGMCRELIATRQFTTDTDIAQAVSFGLNGKRIALKDARKLLAAINAPEPTSSSKILRNLQEPRSTTVEGGALHWSVNDTSGLTPAEAAWTRVLCIEAGWLANDRSGYLQWTQAGRDRFAGAESETFVEAKTGQLAFNF